MEENKQVESATAPTATPAPTTSPVQQKGSNKGLIIAIIIILVLCCIGSLVAAGVYIVGSGFSIFSSTVQENTNNPDEDFDQSTDGQSGFEDQGNGSDADSGDETQFNDEFFSFGDNFDARVDSVRQSGENYEIEMSIKNNASTEQPFSTILYLSLVSERNPDGYSQDFFSPRYYDDGAQLDGNIGAGEVKRGVIVFNVDDNPSTLTLRLTKGLFSSEYVEFKIK